MYRALYPISPHLRPARRFLTLDAIGGHLVHQPEIEPSQIAAIDVQAVGWLALDMEFVRENIDINRTIGSAERADGFQGWVKLPICRLHENRESNAAGIAGKRHLRPDC